MGFEFAETLHAGEGRAYDVTSDDPVAGLVISAAMHDYATGDLIASLNVTDVDPYSRRVHVTDSLTATLAGSRAILRVIVADPAAPGEPDVMTAILTIERL